MSLLRRKDDTTPNLLRDRIAGDHARKWSAVVPQWSLASLKEEAP